MSLFCGQNIKKTQMNLNTKCQFVKVKGYKFKMQGSLIQALCIQNISWSLRKIANWESLNNWKRVAIWIEHNFHVTYSF